MILIYYKTWIYQCLIIQVKSPSIYLVSRPGLGSDPPFGSDRDSGRDTYRLSLPLDLEKIHNVFYVSMLRKYRSDLSHVVSSKKIELRPYLSYQEEPVEILAREVKELQNKKILLVKVLWRNHKTKEATWESEETMRQQYPQLFD